MYASLSIMVIMAGVMYYLRLNGPGTGVLTIAALLIVAHYAREIVELFRNNRG